ncbi:transcriptional regulator [Methanobrevibacter sp.]|uniref:transcriptional regulator n=1 Tax=Methanobrevibacter sp. TaxID=66852 RepID=UPI0026DEA5D5|nr:transcriptional regulator [Methanobrevibacter sp.]MDO5859728.1 transcriptional regulator [Methanobrevibacter sp.]
MDDKVRYVSKSSYRLKVLKSIGNDVKIPKEIARDSGILPNHISNVLRQLKENEIVECINPEVRKGRLYRLSEEGLDVLNKLE